MGARVIAVSGKSGALRAPQGSRERVQAIAVSGKSGALRAPQGSRERVQAIATVAVLVFAVPAFAESPLVSARDREIARQTAYTSRFAQQGMTASAAGSAFDLILAMDVDPALVTSPSLSGNPDQWAVFPSLGTLVPTTGGSFAYLSTGVAGAGTPQTQDPSALGTQSGTNMGGACLDGEGYDCVSLSFSFVVPPDQLSVSFDFNFLSVEYPEYVDLGFNDEFAVSLQSPSHSYPNIVFDAYGNPINIDSAFFNQPCTSLDGTGFEIYAGSGCDAGATGKLTTAAPVEPNETVTITFKLRDRGDGIYDSAVTLDNFVLSTSAVIGPTTESDVKVEWLSPKSGPVAGGTQVQIHGEGFVNVQQVAFGGTPALFQTLDEYTIVALSPPGWEGATDIAVTAAPGMGAATGVKAAGFTYYDDPGNQGLHVEEVVPAEGPPEGGVRVTVRGSGFVPETVMTFDGIAATEAVFINASEMVVRTPPGSGRAQVRAANPDGLSDTLLEGYVYLGEGGSEPSCACRIDDTRAAPPLATIALALVALAIAARRRIGLAFLALGLAACENEVTMVRTNSPPIANAGADGEGFVGEPITLDGTGSHDLEDGLGLSFEWRIESAPEGSMATLANATSVTPLLVPDRAGLYRIGLIVTDSSGETSGEIGFGPRPDDELKDLVVLPYDDFRVTLTWDTDLSDLDVHLIRSAPGEDWIGHYFNRWGTSNDCFYGLPRADWGQIDVIGDNPELLEDVDTGFGPEQIGLASPSDAGTYTVVVHSFNHHGALPTTATVEVMADGAALATATTATTLDATDAVWVVGQVSWPSRTWTPIDMMTTHQALGGPPH